MAVDTGFGRLAAEPIRAGADVPAGSPVQLPDGGSVGDDAVEYFQQFRVDCAQIGATALDEDGAFPNCDIREISVIRTIIAQARQTILVADANEIERKASVRIGGISQISAFVTDRPPPTRFRGSCEAAGVEVIVAPEASGPGEFEHD